MVATHTIKLLPKENFWELKGLDQIAHHYFYRDDSRVRRLLCGEGKKTMYVYMAGDRRDYFSTYTDTTGDVYYPRPSPSNWP